MASFFLFYLSLQCIGFFLFPFSFAVFASVKDKGYGFHKIVSLLILSYVFWITTILHITKNEITGVLIVLLLLSACSYFLYKKQKKEIILFFKNSYRYILFAELLFLISFVSFGFIRSFFPQIQGTEKPFEFMLLNSIHRSVFFPPYDAWYMGASMSYYYFGYIILQTLLLISNVPTAIGFNLGIALTFALTLSATVSLAYNILQKKIAVFCPVFLLLFVGTFEGLFEFLAAHNIGNSNFYTLLGIENLQPYHSLHWFPDQFWFFWRATRMSSSWNVMEFPFFSFLLGDLHPHLLALPFVITILAFGVVLFLQKKSLHFIFIKEHMLLAFLMTLFLGSMIGINTWFYPIYIVYFSLIVLIHNYYVLTKNFKKIVFDSLSFIFPIVIFSFLLFFPILLTARTATGGVAPVEVVYRPDFVPVNAVASPIFQFLIFWSPLLLLVFLTNIVWFKKIRHDYQLLKISFAVGCVPFVLWSLVILRLRGMQGFLQEILVRGNSLFVEILLLFFLTVTMYKLLLVLKTKDALPHIFSSLTNYLAVILITGAELFFIQDVVMNRYNTVFKLYFNAWILLSVGCGIGIALLFDNKQKRRSILLLTLLVCIFSLSLIYPISALLNRMSTERAITLDGSQFLQKTNPDMSSTIAWFNKDVKNNGVILESSGQDYSSDNTVSAFTGLPTVIGWVGTHEIQLHGNATEAQKKLEDVKKIYTTEDILVAEKLIAAYNIMYIVVGHGEIAKYGNEGMAKFHYLGKKVFQTNTISVYKINNAVTE